MLSQLVVTTCLLCLSGLPLALGKTILQIDLADLKGGDSQQLLEAALKNDGALGRDGAIPKKSLIR